MKVVWIVRVKTSVRVGVSVGVGASYWDFWRAFGCWTMSISMKRTELEPNFKPWELLTQ